MHRFFVGEIYKGVLIGQDDYLFLYGGAQKQFSYLTGELEPSRQDIVNFVYNVKRRGEFCTARGIKYLHVVFPSKPVIMRSKLPQHFQEKVLSLFLTHYQDNVDAVCGKYVWYPYELLSSCNDENPIFRTLDTHMSDWGKLSFSNALLSKLGMNHNLTQGFRERTRKASGDLAVMLGTAAQVEEQCFYPTHTSFIADNRLALPSNTGNISIYHNSQSLTDCRLLVFGDSFIKETLRFLSAIFRDILYMRGSFDRSAVDLFEPMVVLSSNTERYLSKVLDDDDSNNLLFQNYGVSKYRPSEAFVNAYLAQLSWKNNRKQYDSWLDTSTSVWPCFHGLGPCQTNSQVKIIDRDSLEFQSIGTDPIFLFHNTSIEKDRRYLLHVDLLSEIESKAVVYYTCAPEARKFSENRAVRLPVRIGKNKLEFELPCTNLEKGLRLDPLAHAGKFKILSIRLSIQPEFK